MTTSHSIGLTVWPERQQKDELAAWIDVMHELEASLRASRKALLALDLEGIERGTDDQMGLAGEIDRLLRRSTTSMERFPESSGLGMPADAFQWEEELRQSQRRILQAVQLQAALLRRSRAKLRMLANMLAGPAFPYGTLLEQRGLSNTPARK